MNNDFCRYLTNGYSFELNQSNPLEISPCCWFRGEKFINGSNFSAIQNQWKSIESWTPACSSCKSLEDAGQQSMRQASFDWIDNQPHTHPVSIDIKLDSNCNAACVICGENFSSLWAKEKFKYQNLKIESKPSKFSIDQAIETIATKFDLTHLNYIKFWGGEPLFTDTHVNLLEKIPHPHNVTVHYTTNGSIFPNDQVRQIWKKFRCVIFAVSVDGIDKQFDYIRWPLTWSKVKNNLLELKHSSIDNVMFRLEFTVNFLNAWYFDSVESWVNQHIPTNKFGDQTQIHTHLYQGKKFDLSCMPQELRNEVMRKYASTHKIHQYVKNLTGRQNLDWFYKFVTNWEQRRGNSWRDSFAEIQHMII